MSFIASQQLAQQPETSMSTETSAPKHLETGDLILLMAQGTDASWCPDSPIDLDPNPPLGYLSAQAYYDHLDAERFLNHIAALGGFRPDSTEPKRIAACVFRVQAVVNREDILRANVLQSDIGTTDNSRRKSSTLHSSRGFGRAVKYGESIQLMHERTKQTLYVNVNDHGGLPFSMKAGFEDLATTDKETFRQEMWFDSWLQVQPPLQNRQAGDPVQYGDSIFLRSDRWKRFLHASANPTGGTGILDMAHRSTRWKIVPYANIGRRDLSKNIVGGSAIRLFHVEAQGFLFQEALHNDFTEKKDVTSSRHHPTHTTTVEMPLSPTSHARSVTEKEEFYKPSSIYLSIPSSKSDREDRRSTSINSLWFLEMLQAEWGGIALTCGTMVRIRHASTNLLLDCKRNNNSTTSSQSVSYSVSMSPDILTSALPNSTIFSIHGPVDKHGYISIESPVQIRHEESGTWIHGLLRPVGLTIPSSCNKKSSSRTKVTLACSKRHQESDSFAFVVPDPVEFPRLLHIMMAWQSFEFFERRLYRLKEIKGLRSVEFKDVIPLVGIFRTLCNAIVSSSSSSRKKDASDNSVVHELGFASSAFSLTKQDHYQELLNEQCIVTGFLHRFQVHQTFPSASGNAASARSRRRRRSVSPSSASRSPAADGITYAEGRNPHILLLKDELLKLVVTYVQKNSKNQLSIMPYLPLIEEMLGVVRSAAAALAETIRDNKAYLQSVTRTRVQGIIRSIDRVGLAPEYLQYLEVLCDCKGNAYRENQILILEELVENRPDLIPDCSCKLNDKSDQIMLLRVPEMSSEWSTIRMSDDNNNKSTGEEEELVANLLDYSAHMYRLLAKLCRGRHYRAQETLLKLRHKNLDFDSLLTVISMETFVTDDFRAAACELMEHLHVDREPRVMFSVVQLTRSWEDPTSSLLLQSQKDDSSPRSLHPLRSFLHKYFEHTSHFLHAEFASMMSNEEEQEHTNHRVNFSLLLSILALCRSLAIFGQYKRSSELRQIFHALIVLLQSTDLAKVAGTRRDHAAPFSVRWADAENRIIEMKLKICDILNIIYNCRLNNQISFLLGHLRQFESASSNPDELAYSSYDGMEEMSKMDMDEVFEKVFIDERLEDNIDIPELYLNFARHCNHKLTGEGYTLFQRHMGQISSIVKSIDQLQLLADGNSIELHAKMFAAHAKLLELTKQNRTIDQKKVVIRILKMIRKEIQVACDDESGSKGDLLTRLVMNLHIHSDVTAILRDIGGGLSSSSASKSMHCPTIALQEQAELSRLTKRELNLCFRILSGLLEMSGDFQSYLISHIDLLIEQLPKNPMFVGDLVKGMVYNNRTLVTSISDNRVRRIVAVLSNNTESDIELQAARPVLEKLLVDLTTRNDTILPPDKTDPEVLALFSFPPTRVLDVLHQLVMCSDGPVQPNQNRVLEAIMTQCPVKVLQMYTGAIGFEIRVLLMEKIGTNIELLIDADDEEFSKAITYCSAMGISSSTNESAETTIDCSDVFYVAKLRYHLRLIRFLTACAAGKNHFVEVECRSLLSFDEIVRGLEHPSTILPVKKALLEFLLAMYLDVQVPIRKIASTPKLWIVIVQCIDVLECYVSSVKREGNEDYAKYYEMLVIECVIPLLSAFYLKYYNFRIRDWEPEEVHYEISRNLVLLGFSILENVRTSISKTLSGDLVDLIENVLHSDPRLDVAQEYVSSTSTLEPSSFVEMRCRAPTDHLAVLRRNYIFQRQYSFRDNLDSGSGQLMTASAANASAMAAVNQLNSQIFKDKLKVMIGNLKVTGGYRDMFKESFRVMTLMRSSSMDCTIHQLIRYLDHDVQITNPSRATGALQFIRMTLDGYQGNKTLQENFGNLTEDDYWHQQCRLSELGASIMVLKLVARNVRASSDVMREGLLLGHSLLRNGNKTVQRAMCTHLESTSLDEPFFSGLVEFIRRTVTKNKQDKHEKLARSVKSFATSSSRYSLESLSVKSPNNNAEDDSEGNSSSTIESDMKDLLFDVLEFLRLLCEDHFLPMQNYLRHQPDNFRTHNVVDQVVSCLRTIQWVVDPRNNISVWNMDATQMDVSHKLIFTLIEFAQGCPANQLELSSTKVCNVLNDILLQDYFQTDRPDFHNCLIYASYSAHASHSANELRDIAILLIYSLLEGNHEVRVISNILRYISISGLSSYVKSLKTRYELYSEWARVSLAMEETTTTKNSSSDDKKYSAFEETLTYDERMSGFFACFRDYLKEQERARGVTYWDSSDLKKHLLALKIPLDASKKAFSAACASEASYLWEKCSVMYATLHSLMFQAEALGATLRTDKLRQECSALLNWPELAVATGCVEIVRNDTLEQLYFLIPTHCLTYWNHSSIRDVRKQLKYRLWKELEADKFKAFRECTTAILECITYASKIKDDACKNWYISQEDRANYWIFITVVVVNVMLMVPDFENELSDNTYGFMAMCILVHACFSYLRLRAYVIGREQIFRSGYLWSSSNLEEDTASQTFQKERTSVKKLFQKKKATTENNGRSGSTTTTFFVLLMSNAKFQVLQFVTSVVAVFGIISYIFLRVPMGLSVVRIAFSFGLLDYFTRYRVLQSLYEAVRTNGIALKQTFSLQIVVVYVFATIGHALFRASYKYNGDDVIPSYFDTLMLHVSLGLREGMDEIIEYSSFDASPLLASGRLIYDTSYWLFHGIWNALLQGIVIDAITSIRNEKSEADKTMQSQCFICGLERSQFQMLGLGFHHHVETEHNMWQYMFLQEYLERKEQSEFTSQESYVWSMLQEHDHSYFPVGKAISFTVRQQRRREV